MHNNAKVYDRMAAYFLDFIFLMVPTFIAISMLAIELYDDLFGEALPFIVLIAIFSTIMLPFFAWMAVSQGDPSTVLTIVPFLCMSILVESFIMVIAIHLQNGVSLGERIVGIRTVKMDGSKLKVWEVFAICLCRSVNKSLLFIGCCSFLWTNSSYAIHDLMLHAKVIEDR